MTICIHWLVQGHIVYTQFVGDLTLKDIDSMALVVDWMLETECDQGAYLIADTRYVRRAPRPVAALRYLNNNFQNFNKIKKILHLSVDTPAQRITDVVARSFRYKWQTYYSYHALYQHLMQIETALQGLPSSNPYHLPVVSA